MTKSFLFYEKCNDLPKFFEALMTYANFQNVIKNRTECLLYAVSNSHKATTEKAKSCESKRKFYLTANDLQEDLYECECAHFMKTASGIGHLSPNNRFIIDT